MSEWIRIRVKDFYKDAVGELEYTYVTREVYEALADTFRKEAHAQEMRDIRHTTKDGYTEGETEDLVELTGESVEDTVIRQMEIETLQKAMQSLTPVQRERLHFYFFEGMTYRQIAAKEGVGEKNIRESINGAVKKIKNILINTPQNVFFCEYLMRGTFSGQMVSSGNPLMSRVWIRHRQTKRTLKNAGEEYRTPSAGWNHAISCQPYPAVQIR